MASFARKLLLIPKPSIPLAVATTAALLIRANSQTPNPDPNPLFSFPPSSRSQCLGTPWTLAFPRISVLHSMAAEVRTGEEGKETLPELLTEFMVDMTCEGCVSTVKNKLQSIDGIKQINVDLENQAVRIQSSLPVKTMLDALEQTGKKARLIGQGSPEDFFVSAAVAEFKGPTIFGVVRLAQANMELARIEANFSGLSAGKHALAINEFGDLTRGPASTGNVFNPPLGDLGTLEAQENGEVRFSGAKKLLRVADLIGRSIVVYETEDKSDPGIAAAVIARSAGVGQNYKKLCTCDGVTIWESN